MAKDTVQTVYFFGFLIAILSLSIFIFLPYASAILFALVLAIVFSPIHKDMLRVTGERRFFAALISTIIVLVLIIIPMFIFGFLLFQELTRLYTTVNSSSVYILEVVDHLIDLIRNISPAVGTYLSEQLAAFDVTMYIEEWISWGLQATNTIFARVFHLIVGGAISLLALFYLFKDGEKGVQYLIEVTPLASGYERTILNRVKIAINSVIGGRVLMGLIQGILTAIAFSFLGIPAPILWGGVATILSVIPMLGPTIVITPAIVYLFLLGNVWGAVLLFIWAMVAVYFVDDVFGPILIEKQGMEIHPFLILISILGGINLFGPVGFIAGPVILALLFVLLELYPTILSDKEQHHQTV